MYEFHSSGIIDMLEKLQKTFDAELHDAQVGESNAAHASSMKVQDLTDAVANGQTGVSRSKEIISSLKQDVATSTVDRDANSKKVANDTNTLNALNTKIAEMKTGSQNPMIQFAVNEQSDRFAPNGSIKAVLQAIDKMLVALVEEEKSDVIE